MVNLKGVRKVCVCGRGEGGGGGRAGYKKYFIYIIELRWVWGTGVYKKLTFTKLYYGEPTDKLHLYNDIA